MAIQGIHFNGFRPIRQVNAHDNEGNSRIDDTTIRYREKNYEPNDTSSASFSKVHIPTVAIKDMMANYQLTKETQEVLTKYYKESENQNLQTITLFIPTTQTKKERWLGMASVAFFLILIVSLL